MGGVLKRIANGRGLLVGDAAGAVSPLTAGGLDPCMRLSGLAAEVTADYLATGDPTALARYSGARFRSRFVSRLWMRRALSSLGSAALVEAGCALIRRAPFDALARHVFFGRGSFPDAGPARGSRGRKVRAHRGLIRARGATGPRRGQPQARDVALSAAACGGAEYKSQE